MKLSPWRSAALAGGLLVLGAFSSLAATADPADVQDAQESNLPRHVSVRNSHGQLWADLSYGANAYEYYHVYSPSSASGGTLTSDRARSFHLSGPEAWSLQGSGKGFTLLDGGGSPVYEVLRWGKQGDGSGPTGTFNGIGGDWKVIDARSHHTVYYIESMDHNYNVLDKNLHLLSVIKPTNHGVVVMDKGNKTWWTLQGDHVGVLSASFMALRGVSPWGRLLMGAYFFPDWW